MPVPGSQLDPDAPTEQFRAVVDRYDCTPNRCTIFPADGDGDCPTAWVTAVEPGFVHLAAHR